MSIADDLLSAMIIVYPNNLGFAPVDNALFIFSIAERYIASFTFFSRMGVSLHAKFTF